MIERILGDKVKPNSIRRANYGNYSIVDTYDFDLKDADKDIIKEITALFIPLFMPKNWHSIDILTRVWHAFDISLQIAKNACGGYFLVVTLRHEFVINVLARSTKL